MSRICQICGKPIRDKACKYCKSCRIKRQKEQASKYYKKNKLEYLNSNGKYYKKKNKPLAGINSLSEHRLTDFNKEFMIIKKELVHLGLQPKSIIPKYLGVIISCTKQGINLSDWDGFVTESPYCPKFNESCREKNREKYGRECFICGKSGEENGQKLSVHHVDMNKQQGCDSDWKLVPLCQSCHARAHNDLWQTRIEYLLRDQRF